MHRAAGRRCSATSRCRSASARRRRPGWSPRSDGPPDGRRRTDDLVHPRRLRRALPQHRRRLRAVGARRATAAVVVGEISTARHPRRPDVRLAAIESDEPGTSGSQTDTDGQRPLRARARRRRPDRATGSTCCRRASIPIGVRDVVRPRLRRGQLDARRVRRLPAAPSSYDDELDSRSSIDVDAAADSGARLAAARGITSTSERGPRPAAVRLRLSPQRRRDCPMRVAFLTWRDTTHPDGGGSEVYVEEVARELAARGHDVTIVCARHPGDAADASELVSGVRVRRVGRPADRLSAGARLAGAAPARRRRRRRRQRAARSARRWCAAAGSSALVHHVHREQWQIIYPGLAGPARLVRREPAGAAALPRRPAPDGLRGVSRRDLAGARRRRDVIRRPQRAGARPVASAPVRRRRGCACWHGSCRTSRSSTRSRS